MTTEIYQAVILGHFQYGGFILALAFFVGGGIFVLRILLSIFHGGSRK